MKNQQVGFFINHKVDTLESILKLWANIGSSIISGDARIDLGSPGCLKIACFDGELDSVVECGLRFTSLAGFEKLDRLLQGAFDLCREATGGRINELASQLNCLKVVLETLFCKRKSINRLTV